MKDETVFIPHPSSFILHPLVSSKSSLTIEVFCDVDPATTGRQRLSYNNSTNRVGYDRTAQRWTPDGESYLARLGLMTGARRDRFLKGLWVAAEGVVYAYDAAVHLLPAGWEAPREWPRVWGIDWGKTAPTVLGVWAVDPDGRMYLVREVYQTGGPHWQAIEDAIELL